MLNATHSKWLPASKTHQTANQGQNPQTTTTRSHIKVLPTRSPEQLEQLHYQRNSNQTYQTATKQFIQLKAANSTRTGTPILVRRQRPLTQQQLRPFFLKNYEILSQESLAQLLNQNQLLNQAHLLNSDQILNQRLAEQIQTIPTEEDLSNQSSPEEDQETTTPVYTIISVPFLARSYLPNSCVQQRKLKTNGLIKTKPIVVNAVGKDGQEIPLYPNQKNISTHLNLLNQQKKQQSNKSSSSQLNTATVQNIHKRSRNTLNTTVCNNINQLNTTTKSSNTTPTSLNTTRTSRTTNSAEMMGIHMTGSEFQDMNSTLPIAVVEELMAPICLDDYLIETHNNSDFEANNGTFKLQGLNEMTINKMNDNFAVQLQSNDIQDEPFMKEVPGEEQYFNITRQPHSEEMIGLTQSSLGQEMSECESLFGYINDNAYINDLITNSDDSLENSSAISPGSPVPTENDCIATSKLHIATSEISLNNNSMQDDETTCRIEFSPNQSDEQYNADDEHMELIMKMLDTQPVQQNLKRNSDHLTDMKCVGAKKTRLNLALGEVVIGGDTLVRNIPDTPEVCNMLLSWQHDNDTSMHSYSSSHSLYETTYSPEESILGQFNYQETKFENPNSVESTYILEEPSYATPSPSNSSSCTIYTTNPNSPAASTYSNGAKKKSRGRPPKQHSDRPDPKVLSSLSGIERKRYEDRCKNNEASRQSRQKNKQKLQEMEAEEDCENNKNDQLKKKLITLEKRHEKLKNGLYKILNPIMSNQ